MKKLSQRKFNELFSKTSVFDVRRKLCGDLIGSGLYRDVYDLLGYPDYVVKIEADMRHGIFANVAEWLNWQNNKDWDYLRDWLVPCEYISCCGRALVQKRIVHCLKKSDFPPQVLVCFTDLKRRNFGMLDGKFVCCDYSYFPAAFILKGGKKYKKAKWWGEL